MKKSTIIALGIVGAVGYGIITMEPNSEEIQAAHLKQCQTEFGAENIIRINKYASKADCRFTDAYEEAQEAIKVAAKVKAEQDKVLAKPVAEVVQPVKLAGVHKTCFETFDAEFRSTATTFSRYKADGKYGTYDDGEIWVGLQHKIYQIQSDGKTGKLSWTGSVSVICTADGSKSFS